MDDFEVRERVIDQLDIFDVIELLGIDTEWLIDNSYLLENDKFRNKLIERIEG